MMLVLCCNDDSPMPLVNNYHLRITRTFDDENNW